MSGRNGAKRICLDCPAITDQSRCPSCRSKRERTRGTPAERGYDQAHKAERARLAPLVATGSVKCWRCGGYIAAGSPWDLGHDDRDRTVHRGPEHVGRECPEGGNRATAGRR